MARNFIPRPDGDFNAWFRNFCDRIIANPAAYGISSDDLAELQGVYASWKVAYPAHTTAQNAARAAAETKDEVRDDGESVARRLAKLVQAQKGTTDAQREELGITVPDRIRTPLSDQIIQTEPPPVIKARCTASKTVQIDWYPSQVEGQSEALPKGIDGVAIWVTDLPAGTFSQSPVGAQAGGGLPAGKQWRFLALDTNSPYIHNVANNATVTLAYKAQWFDRRKRMGPFGDPVMVAVTP